MKAKPSSKVRPLPPRRRRAVAKAGRPEQDSRALLVQVAKSLFAQRGFEGVSIRDIVDEAGVNISLVSYYFGGKEGLLEACLQESGTKYLHLAQRVLLKPESQLDFESHVKTFVEQYLECRIAEISIVRLANAEMEKNSTVFQKLVKTIFMETLDVMSEFFAAGQIKGFMRSDLDPQEVAVMLHGQLNFHLRTDHIRNLLSGLSLADDQVRRKISFHVATVFLRGIVI